METTNMEEDVTAAINPEVRLMKLVKFRASEIHTALEDSKKKFPKLFSQQMPFYMRRRSVSHNVKRMPKRLREKRIEIEGTLAKKTKRPSRRYRRRPSNLLAEYSRRQRDNIWLETHIWFSKRFKMVDKWGYKIAVHPNDKSVRAAYRAVAKYCLMEDISYYGCIELSGPKASILEGLSRLTSPDCGLTFAAKCYESGSREGNVMVYQNDCYPYYPIGPVSFHWKPSNNEAKSKLWMWCHPICYKQLYEELVQVLKLHQFKAAKGKKRKQGEEDQEVEFTIPEFRNEDGILKMILLKDTLNRFRLTGPLSQAVLTESLQVAEVGATVKEGGVAKWWQSYYTEAKNIQVFEHQKSLWKEQVNATSPAELPPKSIIGLTVRDPRIKIPEFRQRAEIDQEELTPQLPQELKTYDLSVSQSPIWDPKIRKTVKKTKIPEYMLNKLKNQEALDENEESRIPILLIQQPGQASSGFNSGYDVIIPSGWAMPFWISFIYRRARAAGLRELISTSLEFLQPYFPDDYPDTLSGETTAMEKRETLLTDHFKYPPDKRPNFEKLGVLSPFFPQWESLITEWKNAKKDGISVSEGVLQRSTTKTPEMETPLLENSVLELPKVKSIDKQYYVLRSKSSLQELKKVWELCVKKVYFNLSTLKNDQDNSLVLVAVKPMFKGVPEEFSQISLPQAEDVFLVCRTKHPRGPQEKHYATTEKEKAKTKKSEEIIKNIPKPSNLIESCNYKIIGYISAGSYSFLQAHGAGLGFCSHAGLLELLKMCQTNKCEPFVLIRAQNSYQYRYAKLSVVG